MSENIELELQDLYEKSTLIINGMTCTSCSSSIESAFSNKNCIKSFKVNLITGTAIVEYNKCIINIRQLIDQVNEMGFHCFLKNEEIKEKRILEKLENEKKHLSKKLVISILCGLIAVLNMLFMILNNSISDVIPVVIPGLSLMTIIMFFTSTFMQFVIGLRFYKNVWKQISNKSNLNMDTLVILSTTLSYILSVTLVIANIIHQNELYHTFFESSIFIFVFIYIGKYLEITGKIWAAQIMNNLIDDHPKKVLLVKNLQNSETENSQNLINNDVIEIDQELITIGDILLIKPNTKISCDAKVILNTSYVNESMLTGESKAVFKDINSIVYNGTINVSDPIYIKVIATGKNTVMNRIIQLIEDAQIHKTQLQSTTDFICKWFVYLVLIISLVDFIIWCFIGYFNVIDLPNSFNYITFALYLSISVIVVACPCALGLATPMAVMIGSGMSLSKGILLKNGADSIEKMSKINTLIFDKTGTLTTGEMSVVDSYIMKNDQNILNYTYTLSNISNHPLSNCLSKYSINYNNNFSISSEKIHFGKGVECSIENNNYYLGSKNWLYNNRCRIELEEKLKEWDDLGYSVVLQKHNNEIVAGFAISDTIRNNASSIIRKFKSLNINIWMLTGDNLQCALKVAKEIGIDSKNVIADLSPESKAQAIINIQCNSNECNSNEFVIGVPRQYQRLNKTNIVAMVGDGGNDSIALAQADVGIAMKTGSDLALSSSSVILLKSELNDILNLKIISDKIMKKIYINLIWAIGYNIIGIPLAAGVFYPIHLNPIFSSLTMSLSSVLVVMNSLLLKYELN